MIVNPGIRRFLGSAIQRLFNSASFSAPLTHSLVLERGTGSPTFTRASTATVMGYGPTDNAADGLKLLTVAANEARFVGARRISEGVWSNTFADGSLIPAATNTGYLAEGARTNLLTYSQDFSNAAWTKSGSTVTANATTAPDGTLTADKITATSVTASVYQATTGTVMSVYAKQAELNWISIVDVAGVAGAAWFNLTTGVLGTVASGYTAEIKPEGEGFYRCSVKKDDGAAFAFDQYFPVNGDASLTVDASGTKGIFLWGGQSEAGSSASTYIPTTTAAVTRAADVLTYTGGDIANLKTLCATFRREVGVVGTGESVALSDGTTTNYIVHAAQPNGTDVRFLSEASSVTQWSVITAYTPGTTTKMATSFATNDIKMAKDGVGQTPDTVATVPAFTQLNVGHIAGILQLNGTIRNVRIWQRALSTSELQAITR